MKQARIRMAVGTGILTTIGVALIGAGVTLIEKGEVVAGGILAGVGAVILVIADYVGR